MMWGTLFLSILLAPQKGEVVVGERTDVLFIGDRGHHQPFVRIKDVWASLSLQGIAVEWEENLESVTTARLKSFDCVMMYANQAQHAKVPQEFFLSLQDFVRDGGGFIALHCTSGCFMESQEWLELVGARFVSHGDEVFSQEVVDAQHPLVKGWSNFESWDETYVQKHFDGGRTVLAMRGDEPWMWVRREGQGRVFYCASGHDERTWREPGFLDLLVRAVDWTSGEAIARKRLAFALPTFDYEERDFVPNYEAREPRMKYQLPSTPAQAQAHLQPPAGMKAQLFASEPMVINPIAMDWDLRGRCWVIETPNYPNEVLEGKGEDRISILEDTDGDGLADKKIVFAEGLNLPTGILVFDMATTAGYHTGVIVAMAPDLLVAIDRDGDDRVDVWLPVATGFGRFDTHAGPSNLMFGPDNRVWGAVGYSSFSRADGSKFGSGLWNMQLFTDIDYSDLPEPQFVAQFTNNTWGLGLRDDGEVFGSTANGAPSFFVGASKEALKKSNPTHAGAMPIHDSADVFPALSEIRQGDWLGQYTAAAGHSFATGQWLPSAWDDRTAFICSPTAHTVGRFDSYSDGSGWRTRNAINLCASTDEWFCPVQASVGPDGAVWIADFAQFIILHNLPGNPERGLPKIEYGDGNAHLNPMRDKSHGRIWRLLPEEGDSSSVPYIDTRKGSGHNLFPVLGLLGHPNRFWRSAARRYLVFSEGLDLEDPSFRVPLLRLIRGAEGPLATLESLRVFFGVSDVRRHRFPKLDEEVFPLALQSNDYRILIAGLDALPSSVDGALWLLESGALDHPSSQIRRHALLAASRMPESPLLGIALVSRAVIEPVDDAWISVALRAAVATHANPFLKAAVPLQEDEAVGEKENYFPNPSFEIADDDNLSNPIGWRVRVYSGEAQHLWVANEGRSGSRALKIVSDQGADTSWCTDIAVEPNTRYRLSGWIRTEGVTHQGSTYGALMNVHPTRQVTESVVEDTDWTQVTLEFATDIGQNQISVNCLYGGWGKSTGSAFWDDVTLHRLGSNGGLDALIDLAEKHADAPLAQQKNPFSVIAAQAGDSERGRQSFLHNDVISCNRCHALAGIGGGIGPALDGIGSRLSEEQILQSILDPNATLAESWSAPVSAMPALQSFMTGQEILDIVSFLTTLKQ